ncbi:hypothetical protein G6L86_18800 [Agrobacterium tumefaciens]|uniref:hypothetical protein n=1 Tax=Agrobacterium tumefaciens TaxID=358 RepID=UPI0015723978|nr:hypothetical protein [Agrobacterium tumefaciens]NSX87656.1 hypothetical protein [Agrobacterium tumefaciens]
MMPLPPNTMSALGFIAASRAEWKLWSQLLQNADRLQIAPPDISIETRAIFLNSCKVLGEAATLFGLTACRAAADRAFKECFEMLAKPIGYDFHRLARIVNLAEHLIQVFNDEIQGRQFLVLSNRYAHLFEEQKAFGVSVDDAFPGAAFDIAEAAKCLALGRWTACVMHTMRALELALVALAHHYQVEHGENWNQTLNRIESASREIGKRSHGAAEEQWAAEAATHLRFVKNAWRNHAMHPRATYDEERAVAIFEASRSFMKHLAEKISEDAE